MTAPAPTARRIDAPEPVLLAIRMRKGAPVIPARIWRPCTCTPVGGDDQHEHDWTPQCDRFPQLAAEVNGRPVESVDWLWTSGREIPEAEWRLMTERIAWDAKHDPDAPSQRPAEAIDPLTSRLAF